uniref:Apelin n=1 Tax=Sphenodon punctatus TaxID=8508 RepID=A0A8D0HLM8_SPHPU
EAPDRCVLLLTSCLLSTGPLTEALDGKEPEDRHIRNLVHPKGVRHTVGHRQNGWRKYQRRPRPRLSHKGPMPF